MFELLSPRNRIIVPVRDDRLVLLGVRDMRALRRLYVISCSTVEFALRLALVFIGTLCESHPDECAAVFGYATPPLFPELTSIGACSFYLSPRSQHRHLIAFALDAVVEAAARLDPAKQEGFVVVDRAFRRLKVKSPRYA